MLEMPENNTFYLLYFGAYNNIMILVYFSRLFGSVAKSCMQKQPQSGGPEGRGSPLPNDLVINETIRNSPMLSDS